MRITYNDLLSRVSSSAFLTYLPEMLSVRPFASQFPGALLDERTMTTLVLQFTR